MASSLQPVWLFVFPMTVIQAGLPVADLERNTPVDFASEIYPFLKANCLSCHNSTKAKAELILESPQMMIKGGDSGPALVVGDADASLIFTTATHIEEPVMPPPNNKAKAKDLSPQQLALLKRWINEGAKGDAVSTAAPKSWTHLSGPQPIYSSAITNDGRFAAVGRGQSIELYDLRLGRLITSLLDPALETATAHRDMVQALAFSQDGVLASGGFRTAKIWQRGDLSPNAPYLLPQEATVSRLSPTGTILAVGLKDGTIALVDYKAAPKPPTIIKAHAGVVNDLVFSGDGTFLYSSGADKIVKRITIATPDQSISLTLPTAARSIILVDGCKQLLVGCDDHALRLSPVDGWASQTGLETRSTEYKFEPQVITGLGMANAGGTEWVVAYQNGILVHLKLEGGAPKEVRRYAHGGPVNQMAVSGNRLASAGATGVVKLWDLATGKLVADLSKAGASTLEIAALTRQRDIGNRLKVYWNGIVPNEEKLWKAESEKARVSGSELAKAIRDQVARRAAWTALRKLGAQAKPADLAAAEEALKKADQAVVSATRNREASSRLAGDSFARQISAEASAAEAAARSDTINAEIEALRKAEAELVQKFASASLAFSPDGSSLAVGLKDGGLRLWAAHSGEWLEDQAPVHAGGGIQFIDQNRILVLTPKKEVILWNLPGESWSLAKSLGNGSDAKPFSDRVSALEFHPGADQLLIGTGVASRSGEISIWNTTTWELLAENTAAHDDTITAFAFSSSGERFASAGTDRLVKIFDSKTLELLQTFEGHTSHVLDVDWHSDDLSLVSSSGDLQVKIWDITENRQKSKVEGFAKEVTSVSFVADSDTLLTTSGDKSLKLANLPLPGAGTTVLNTASVSGDGKVVIAAGEDSVLRVWDGVAKKLTSEFPAPTASIARAEAQK